QQPEGFCMNVYEDNNNLYVSIASARPAEGHDTLYLAFMTGDADKSLIRQVNMADHQAQISFQTEELPAGFIQIALFSNDSMLCTRLWYRKSKRQPLKAESFIQGTAKTREMVDASVDFPAYAGNDKILAVSVTEYNAVTDSLLYNEADHYRYFDLYSALFQPHRLPLFDTTTSADYINDCLMAVPVTLAMHKILYSDNGSRGTKERQGLVYTGRVVDSSTKLPVSNAMCILSYPDAVAHISYSQTDETGRFFFTLNDKHYNRQLYITVLGFPQSTSPVSIIADDPFDLSVAGFNVMPLDHQSFEPVISKHKNVAMAYRVFYSDRGQATPALLNHYAVYEKDFYGSPDFTLIPAEYEPLPDIFEIRKNLIPPLKIKIDDDYCPMFVFDDYVHLFPDKQAFVMLNSIPYPSLKNILGLNSDLIRKIDIKYGRHYYDHFLMYGIVSISTTKPVIIEPYFSTHIATVRIEAELAGTRSTPLISEGTMPDVRHSLYWETVSADIDDAENFQFRTSDIKGKYQLRVFSVARDGSLHCTGKMITVQ
ncbi:MAG: hypothetical protein JXR41_09650, partial [Bacteroidales bacterium]|nr:hypothetical protein [Bacteroidales bacterium]